MVCVYRKHHFVIYSNSEGFIIHNTHKEFENGHTHISNYNTAKYLVNLACYHRLPNRKSKYFYESIMRISDDKQYIKLLDKHKRLLV